jgi:hypothetical protein
MAGIIPNMAFLPIVENPPCHLCSELADFDVLGAKVSILC